MHTEWFENLFGEGWRDPSEDVQRLTVYILLAIGGAFGVVAFGYGIYEVFAQGVHLAIIAALIVAGPAVAYPCLQFLWKESKHWEMGFVDAEQVVTCGFLFGFAVLFLGVDHTMGWRVALIVPGVLMLIMAVVYWRFTQDCPEGNFADLRARGEV